MAHEVNLGRAINALSATLADQKLTEFDAKRVQEIATGAVGGERELVAYGSGTSGELRDGTIEGPVVAKLSYADGRWTVERVPEARKSKALEQSEEQRANQKKTEYQKPLRGRLAIWKSKLSG